RDQETVDAGAEFCIAFHKIISSSRGAKTCVRRDIAAGIPTYLIDSDAARLKRPKAGDLRLKQQRGIIAFCPSPIAIHAQISTRQRADPGAAAKQPSSSALGVRSLVLPLLMYATLLLLRIRRRHSSVTCASSAAISWWRELVYRQRVTPSLG